LNVTPFLMIDYQSLRAWFERFAPLPADAWAALVPHLQPRSLAKHQAFVQPGEQALHIGFLVKGTCRQFYLLPDGTERTTYFYFANDGLADYRACVLGQPAALTIEALVTSEIVSFPYAALTMLYDQFPAWERIGRRIAEYLTAGLEARLVELLTLSPEDRYRLLVATPAKRKLLEQVPQHLLAAYLGITPVSLSRIRNRVASGVS
jgi:CRP-like cAMP-binding protein